MANEHPLFRTTRVSSLPCKKSIFRKEKMLWMGSCFVESMTPFIQKYEYQALINPFGVIFHPLVLEKVLFSTYEELVEMNFERNGVWQNFWLGAPFAGKSNQELSKKISTAVDLTKNRLYDSNWLIFTWGTSFWYQHKTLGMVGKCHKIPQENFRKKISEVEELVGIWEKRIETLKIKNPDLKIIFTLSPVRHTRDTLEGNTISKSTLRLAIEKLRNRFDFVFYFPAYELVIDELRDYRFFEKDLIHPNKEAIEYIWEQFSHQFFPKEEQKTNEMLNHFWVFNSHSPNVNYGDEFELQIDQKERLQSEINERLLLEKPR
jgi:hypothetical protein